MPERQHPFPYLLTLRTPQSAFMLGFAADTAEEAHRFAAAWVENQSVRPTSRVTLTCPDGTVSGVTGGPST